MHPSSHHISQRKRAKSKLNMHPYPHKNKWINRLDTLVLIIGIIGPLSILPQIFKIFVEHDASGLSIYTWSFFIMMNIPWIAYGVLHKEKVIYIAHSLWLISHVIVLIGIVMYS